MARIEILNSQEIKQFKNPAILNSNNLISVFEQLEILRCYYPFYKGIVLNVCQIDILLN